MRRAVAAAFVLATPAAAQPGADPALADRAAGLIPVLTGAGDGGYFADSFRSAVPPAKLAQVLASMRASLGEPRGIAATSEVTRWSETVVVRYDRGTATVRLAIEPTAPHLVSGLLITGTTVAGDSFAAIDTAAATLPGAVAIGLYALDGSAPTPLYARGATEPVPLGSSFKLWILAEAARQVATGQRHWSDVIPVGPPSLPSGMLQRWPAGTPMTLQALATLMVSISDNTAADTLLVALGRRQVDAMAAAHGGSTPVPTTRELFVLKSDPALTAAWASADPAGRRALLSDRAATMAHATIDPAIFAGGPVATDRVEWFAPPSAMATLLDTLRRDPVAAAIMAVNPGTDRVTAARFAYVGYKGGSEPGVLTMNFVVRTKAGHWFALSTAWHRSDAAVEEAVLAALAARALGMAADR